jgi:hypothetical protein
MASTNRGVCLAQFGFSKETLVKQLREEFAKASIVESFMTDSPELDDWTQAFERVLRGRALASNCLSIYGVQHSKFASGSSS